MDTPNSSEETIENAEANPQDVSHGTVQESEVAPIDYKEKFSASSAEALRLLEENKAKDAEIARLQTQEPDNSEELYPGFEDLDTEAQQNLNEYTKAVEKKVREGIYNDPAISYARQTYNEKKFNDAFESISTTYPELKESKEDFKSKYFQPTNTPENIEQILTDLAKGYLFDQAREMGASDERSRSERIDTERAMGGPRTPQTSRSLDEWQRIAKENPAKFAQMSKEYQADIESGKLRE